LRLNVGLGSGFFLVVAGFLGVVFLFGGVVVVVLPEVFVVGFFVAVFFTEGFFAGCLDVGVFDVFAFAFGVVVVFFLGGITNHLKPFTSFLSNTSICDRKPFF